MPHAPFGPGPAQADAPDVEPGEPLGYLVRFGHGARAGLQFYGRDADAQASFIGNGATVVPLVDEAIVTKLRAELAEVTRQRDLARRGCICPNYGVRSHHGMCPALKPEPPTSPCPAWCATHDPLDFSSAIDGDRRYASEACRAAGRCINKG